MMIENCDGSVEIDHNPKLALYFQPLFSISIIGGLGQGRTNVESKSQLLINVRGKVKITKFKKPKAFIDYL